MIKEEELVGREEISNEEIKYLMDEFNVTEMDLADECGCTHSTFSIYLGNNETAMPQKHQQTIIHYFLRQFGVKEKSNTNGQSKETTTSNMSDVNSSSGLDLNHLIPDVIIYKPKKKVSNALEEAARIAKEKDTEVGVKVGNRKIFVRVEEE